MVPGLREFLESYPEMSVRPIIGSETVVEGEFQFTAVSENYPQISDSYRLRISVPSQFPAEIPTVVELGNRIPRTADFHVNPDASICLGSPLRLLLKLSRDPTLVGFVSYCLIPYLYAISHKLKFGGRLPFSELKHGREGELEDYMELLGLERPEQADRTLRLLGMKKRNANKLPCPCGCDQRLGKCSFNKRLAKIRQLAGRSWFRRLTGKGGGI